MKVAARYHLEPDPSGMCRDECGYASRPRRNVPAVACAMSDAGEDTMKEQQFSYEYYR